MLTQMWRPVSGALRRGSGGVWGRSGAEHPTTAPFSSAHTASRCLTMIATLERPSLIGSPDGSSEAASAIRVSSSSVIPCWNIPRRDIAEVAVIIWRPLPRFGFPLISPVGPATIKAGR